MTLAIKPFVGDGLATNRDETWRLHRKLITPAFHVKILETCVEIFSRKAEILTENIRPLADGKTVDIINQLSLCALDAICETAIGKATFIFPSYLFRLISLNY
jgi:cytochrome P450 family 4